MAREVFDPHRRQDQEARVADDLLEAPGLGGIVSADPLIASLKAPGRRGELQAAQDHGMRGCRLDQVAEMGTKGHAMAEIMMALDERAPERPLSGRGHALKLNRPQRGKRRVCRRRFRVGTDKNGRTRAARTSRLQRGQADQSRLLHPFEERPTFDRLRLSVGAVPIEEFAHRSAEFMAA